MRIFLFVLAATALEATGDTVLRMALHHPSMRMRIGLFAIGSALLTLYGTSLNLAPVEFAAVTGLYIALLFIVFQITNYIFFRILPSTATMAGGALIVAGGLIVFFKK